MKGVLWSRGYLPHLERADGTMFVTWRLADAVPLSVWQAMRSGESTSEYDALSRHKVGDQALDLGLGACHLARNEIAESVVAAILTEHGRRIDVHAFCVMPNHVHVLLRIGRSVQLPSVMQAVKSVSAHRANRLLGREGRFWQKEYFDVWLKSGDTARYAADYIETNPVAAGLCARGEDWRWSSANRAYRAMMAPLS